jgi:hypothetical protein
MESHLRRTKEGMMSAHTPEPFEQLDSELRGSASQGITLRKGADGWYVKVVRTGNVVRFGSEYAAAPDLLAALDELVFWLGRHAEGGGEVPTGKLMDDARAALAKAGA